MQGSRTIALEVAQRPASLTLPDCFCGLQAWFLEPSSR